MSIRLSRDYSDYLPLPTAENLDILRKQCKLLTCEQLNSLVFFLSDEHKRYTTTIIPEEEMPLQQAEWYAILEYQKVVQQEVKYRNFVTNCGKDISEKMYDNIIGTPNRVLDAILQQTRQSSQKIGF